ncbi:hypothetical protein L9F63_002637 [Diploptera punctata]|uniref:Oxidation resistance protein 1 n=1 Tax=Diploptera punctata TaxID=6984 RepID=A0AAD7ZRW4_DIPPU|nr:hypothetical protein L9F63_002637 [Diploptera punctata]
MKYLEMEDYTRWIKVCQTVNDPKIEDYAGFLCEDLITLKKTFLDFEDINEWYRKANVFSDMQQQIFEQLYQLEDDGEFGTLIPLFLDREQILKRDKTILDIISILFVKSFILNADKDYWQILYSNVVHGVSLLSLVDQIKENGPTLLVIRDNDNFVFGGYASESWKNRTVWVLW